MYRYHPHAYFVNNQSQFQTYGSYYPNYNGESGRSIAYPLEYRQQVTGQATWTEGGQVTKCNIPWSDYNSMTAAVGEDSPFKCGEIIKVRNLSAPVGREIFVKIVDEVQGYPINRINLHRNAFSALGVNPNVGVINVEMIPLSGEQENNWEDYFIGVVQSAFPGYSISNYQQVGKTGVTASQTKDTYEFMLTSPQGGKRVLGELVYNANTNNVISLELREA